jgi:hypothetical protein
VEQREGHHPIRQHTSAYVSIRQHKPAYASIRQHTWSNVRGSIQGRARRGVLAGSCSINASTCGCCSSFPGESERASERERERVSEREKERKQVHQRFDERLLQQLLPASFANTERPTRAGGDATRPIEEELQKISPSAFSLPPTHFHPSSEEPRDTASSSCSV